MDKQLVEISKFVSLLLRHKPEEGGITVDENGGWADVEELLDSLRNKGYKATRETLDVIVNENTKPRYSYNENRDKIRANYGHSIPVVLHNKAVEPPEFLYHGTVDKFMDSIRQCGILPQKRQYVHLSGDIDTAKMVAMRKGKPVILKILAKNMYDKGYRFYYSGDKIWLTEKVPPDYIIYYC